MGDLSEKVNVIINYPKGNEDKFEKPEMVSTDEAKQYVTDRIKSGGDGVYIVNASFVETMGEDCVNENWYTIAVNDGKITKCYKNQS